MKFGSLSITTTDGRTRDYPVDLTSLVIGRADGNSIVVEDLSVARRHARVLIDSGRLMVEDLGSSTGTFVGGERIPANTLSLVGEGEEIRLGDVVVRYRTADEARADDDEAAPAAVAAPGAAPDLAAPRTDVPASIRVVLSVPPQPAEPGGRSVAAELLIHNRGRVVDELIVVVNDLPAEWVAMPTPRIILRPNEQGTVPITISPPRRPDSHAGYYDFSVTVTSQETGREAVVNGSVSVLAYEGTELDLQPSRSKRDFRLVASNHGNALATYALSGTDDEEAFTFQFDRPALELPAGESTSLPFRVKGHKRALFGPKTAQPFTVIATPTTPGAEKSVTQGQLIVSPPLEPLKRPAMFMAILVLVAVAAIGILFRPSNQEAKAAGTEEAYAGVHLCDKDGKPTDAVKQAEAAASATTTASGGQIPKGANNDGGPYFAQNDPQWANQEYAKAKDPDFGPDWCGTTIAQCGCAMTSVTTVMALYDILQMPDGSDLTPKTVNDWFNGNARKTTRGWVSQGYIYGDVIWTAANQLSGEIAKIRPGSPTIKFSRTGTGSEDEIRTELKAGRPIVLEVPGHWISAVGLDGDKILINDPFYRDRKTLDAYAGKVKSSVLFEPSDDLSAVVITVPADERVRVTDKSGRVVGSLNAGSADDAKKAAKVDIPGASYSNRQAWRDPTCIASAPPPGAGTNQIVLPGSAADYKIEVLDTSGGNASVAIHTYGKDGTPSVKTIDNAGSVVAAVGYDPNKAEPDVKVLDEKPQTDASSDRAAGAKPSPSPTQRAAPSASPTDAPPTATPTPGPVTTILSLSVSPGSKVVNIGSNFGFALGDTIRFSPGAANEEDNTIVGFGSFILAAPLKYAHSAGEPILRLAGSPTGGAPPPPPAPEVKPPDSVHLSCSPIYSTAPRNATLICTANIEGLFTTTRWTIDGRVQSQFTGQAVLLAVFTQDATTAIAVSACNVTVCASDAATQAVRFPLSGNATPAPTTTPPAPTPTPPPAPATGIAASCHFTIDTSPQANVTCEPLTKQTFTSITWSAPGLTPNVGRPSPDGAPFKAIAKPGDLTPDKNGNATVQVTATLCGAGAGGAGACTVSPPAAVTIPYATTTLSVLPGNPQKGTTVAMFAVIKGPVQPNGGTVRFLEVTDPAHPKPIGLDVKILQFPGFAFAQLNFGTGNTPLDPEGAYKIVAAYSGSTNIFGGDSASVDLNVTPPVPDVCNGLDDNGDGQVDESCVVPGDTGAPQQKDIGGGTVLSGVAVTGLGVTSDFVGAKLTYRSAPGTQLTVAANGTRQSTTDGSDPYCANCTRQVYLGIGPNTAAVPPVAPVGPYCVLNQSFANFPSSGPDSQPFSSNVVVMPKTPGLYYIRATSSLQSGCGQPDVGAPDASIARVIVKGSTRTDAPVITRPGAATDTHLGDHVTFTSRIHDAADDKVQVQGFVAFCATTGILAPTPTDPCNHGQLLQVVPVTNGPVVGPTQTRQAVLDFDTTALYSSGIATGTYQITAHFVDSGSYTNDFYKFSDSAGTPLDVKPAATTVHVSFSQSNPKLGDTVVLTAIVNSGSFGPFTAGGTVQFFDGASAIGGPQAVTGAQVGLGTLTYDTSNFFIAPNGTPVGNHNISAQYSGNGNYDQSTATGIPSALTLLQASTSVSVSAPGTANLGDTISVKATLGPAVASAGKFGDIGGTVRFRRDGTCGGSTPTGTSIGTMTVPAGTTETTLSYDSTGLYSGGGPNPLGVHTFCAEYVPTSPTDNYGAGNSSSVNTTIGSSAVAIALDDPSPGTLALGTTLTLVGRITTPNTFGAFSGTVQFRDSNVLIGTGTVGTDGVASCLCDTTAFAGASGAIGTHQVFARYLGSGNYASADSPTKPLVVTVATTSIAQTVPGTVQLGAATNLTATVTSTGSYGNFSGTIDFTVGGTTIATGNVNNTGHVTAAVDWSLLPDPKVGSHTVIANYSGGGNYGPAASGSSTMNVTGAALSLILSSDKSSATAGATVTFTASAAGSFGTPTGTVTLTNGSGATIGTGSLDAGGIATIPLTNLASGANVVTASIPATGDYAAKTSNSVTVSIQKSTTTSVNVANNPMTLGASNTISGTVQCPSCPSNVKPSGPVTFLVDGVQLVDSGGATVTATANNSGDYTVTTTALGTALGPHPLLARYGGSSSLASSDSLPITFTVQATTTTTLATVTTPVVAGLSQTFTATVTAGATGTVDFKDGGTTIGSGTLTSGTATFTTSTLTAGGHNITAVYSGDTLYLTSTSAAQAMTVVAKAPTSLVVTAPATAVHNTSVTFTAQVTCSSACTGAGAFAGAVTFTDGATTLGTGTVQADGSASFTLAAGLTTTGSHTITATYAGTGSNYAASTNTTGINIT